MRKELKRAGHSCCFQHQVLSTLSLSVAGPSVTRGHEFLFSAIKFSWSYWFRFSGTAFSGYFQHNLRYREDYDINKTIAKHPHPHGVPGKPSKHPYQSLLHPP